MEATSLTGDIALLNGQPAAHLLELVIGPTLELFLTAEPTTLYKKRNAEFDANVIEPALTK